MDNNMDTLYAEHSHMMHCREVPLLPSYLRLSQACIHYVCISMCSCVYKEWQIVSNDF